MAVKTIEVRVGSPTPWGQVEDAYAVAEGIWRVHTGGHGGLKLSADKNKLMPPVLRQDSGWYEEDCEWSLVVIAFPDDFEPKDVALAHEAAELWHPSQYRAARERGLRDTRPKARGVVMKGVVMKNKQKTIEVRMGHPWTAVGSILRVVRECKWHSAMVNGRRETVMDPHRACYVYVDKLPRDLDRRGYE